MASDADYMAFINKANQDPSEGFYRPQGPATGRELKAADPGASIHPSVEAAVTASFYVSDADEPFVPVSLAWDEAGKTLPDEGR